MIIKIVSSLFFSFLFLESCTLIKMKLGASAGGVLLHCETHEVRTYLHEVVDCDLVVGTFLKSYTLHRTP